jgi:magnesium transporter
VKLKSKHNVMRIPRSVPGTVPGALFSDPAAEPTTINVLGYGLEAYHEQQKVQPEDVRQQLGRWPVLWVDVDGLRDVDLLSEVASLFPVHRLALEDVVNVPQRPKIELYDEQLFVVMRMVLIHEKLEFEQVSVLLGKDFVLSFHEGRLEGGIEDVRERIRKSIYRIRGAGPDYLAYALIDAIVDGYFPVLEEYGERIEDLEDTILSRPEPGFIAKIHDIRSDLLTLRRGIWSLREALSNLFRDLPPAIQVETYPFLRDCADHAGQILDLLESQRELCAGLMDVYLSSSGHKMNEIMKLLTILSALFIPLTFIAGVYGMNFDPESSIMNMPELRWAFGYPFVLGLMATIVIVLVWYFRRKGWL